MPSLCCDWFFTSLGFVTRISKNLGFVTESICLGFVKCMVGYVTDLLVLLWVLSSKVVRDQRVDEIYYYLDSPCHVHSIYVYVYVYVVILPPIFATSWGFVAGVCHWFLSALVLSNL